MIQQFHFCVSIQKKQNYLLTVTAHLKMSAAAQVVPEKKTEHS